MRAKPHRPELQGLGFMEFRVEGFGFRVEGSGFRVLGFWVPGLWGLGFMMVWG